MRKLSLEKSGKLFKVTQLEGHKAEIQTQGYFDLKNLKLYCCIELVLKLIIFINNQNLILIRQYFLAMCPNISLFYKVNYQDTLVMTNSRS